MGHKISRHRLVIDCIDYSSMSLIIIVVTVFSTVITTQLLLSGTVQDEDLYEEGSYNKEKYWKFLAGCKSCAT